MIAGFVLLFVGGASVAKDPPVGLSRKDSGAPFGIRHDRPMRTPAVNATPLEMEVGYANYADFLVLLSHATKWTPAGINVHTHGLMYESDGDGLGIDGLTHAKLIFDLKTTLQGVVLTFPLGPGRKGATADMARSLGKKYKLVAKDYESFLDYGTFRFEKGDSIVMVNSPHLSFEMTVIYATQELYEANKKKLADDERQSQEHKDKML